MFITVAAVILTELLRFRNAAGQRVIPERNVARVAVGGIDMRDEFLLAVVPAQPLLLYLEVALEAAGIDGPGDFGTKILYRESNYHRKLLRFHMA